MDTTEKLANAARHSEPSRQGMPRNPTCDRTRIQSTMIGALIVALGVGLALPAPLRSMSKAENIEWTKALAGISSGQTKTALSETRPADKKIAKPAGAMKSSKG